jgi:hypothetical protein
MSIPLRLVVLVFGLAVGAGCMGGLTPPPAGPGPGDGDSDSDADADGDDGKGDLPSETSDPPGGPERSFVATSIVIPSDPSVGFDLDDYDTSGASESIGCGHADGPGASTTASRA